MMAQTKEDKRLIKNVLELFSCQPVGMTFAFLGF